jgi:uncharacterized protein YcnI
MIWRTRGFTAFALLISGMLALPFQAAAHVTLNPDTVPANHEVRIDVRVPNEEDVASTKKLAIEIPAGVYYAIYQPVPGWKISIATKKLATPVKVGADSASTEAVSATFMATGAGIQPGQFQDFGLVINTPNNPGTTVRFPAVQTYSNGDIVRWSGALDAAEPVPHLNLTAAASVAGKSDGTIAWIALGVGIVALLIGAGALAAARRKF